MRQWQSGRARELPGFRKALLFRANNIRAFNRNGAGSIAMRRLNGATERPVTGQALHQPSKQVRKAVASFTSTDRVIFWEGGMENKALEREKVERTWFLRVATVLMVGMIAVGAIPLLKNALFPVERIR